MLKRAFSLLVCLGLLAACDTTGSLRQLKSVTPTGDAYAQALAAAYRDYAEEKAARYEWESSQYFADKGLLAAYGREISPEEPARWDIPTTMLPEFNEVRGKLLEAIAANRTTQPEMSASASLAFDRWVELQHYGWDEPAIEAQRDVFFAILSRLQEAHASNPAEVPTTTIPVPTETTSTVLYFPLDSDTLGDSAHAALAELVRYVGSAGQVKISVNGHTDRSGSEEYNLDLSQRRSRVVVAALLKAGIAESLITYFAFGESDPAVPTADGVQEPKNRRVEIYFE
jgi:OOP family OmpA-OmpF porin